MSCVKGSIFCGISMLVLQGWSDDTAWLHHHGIKNGELLRLDETSYYERILDELILINGEMDDMQREQLERAEALIATNQYGWTDVITNEAGDVLGEVIGLDYRGIPIYEGSYSLDAAGTGICMHDPYRIGGADILPP